MKKPVILVLFTMFNALAWGGLDLKSLHLEELCQTEGEKEVLRSIYDADQRSVDVICKVPAPKELLNHKVVRQSKEIPATRFEDEIGTQFSGLSYNTGIIAGGTTSAPQYKEFRHNGKLLGYRGTITVSNGKDLNAILGAYYTADQDGKIKDLAKIFVIDRSKVVHTNVPADLKPALDVFGSLVIPAEKQNLWDLTATVTRMPGKDVNYGTSNILLKLAENLGGTAIYNLVFTSLKNVKEPAKFLLAHSGRPILGAFCENLIVDGKPLNAEDFRGKDAEESFSAACLKATDDLIRKVSAAAKKTHLYLLYSELDEEQRGYLLIPSNLQGSEDTFLKVFFDISHNE